LISFPLNGVVLNKSSASCESKPPRGIETNNRSKQNAFTCNNSRFSAIPDYYQNDTSFGGFPDGGQMYCGPVAVSNSLMYLIGNTIFEDTFPGLPARKDQHTLINKIASPEYIGTGRMGTSPSGICKGVDKFLLDNNYTGATLSYYGWRPVPAKYHKQSRADLISMEGLLRRSETAIWLNFGWYSYQKDKNQYIRTGGHWVTLIDILRSDTLSIVVHDPATIQTGNDTIHLTRLSEGFLITKITLLPVCASGYYMFTNKSGQHGVVDGFITLEMPLDTQPKSSEFTTEFKN
jgi:hypothetical protein